MRRILCIAVLVGAAVAGGFAAAASAAPPPSFATAVTDDGSCMFTLTATWKNAKVDQVFGLWYLDDATVLANFLFTTAAPGTGPNGGTLKGRTAIMRVGPLAGTAETHRVIVLVQFYNNGAAVADVQTSVDAQCTRN